MMRTFALAGAAALALAMTASLSMAQPDKGPPTTMPPTSQGAPATPAAPATSATPATPATPGESGAMPATPAGPATPATPASPALESHASAAPQGCRTRKEAGEPCACRSDPTRVGVSTASPTGQNICVRPD
jgi:hypothetical protein